MKKLGFTLAEVLISLAIVGVVAAMTIPTLSSNTQQQSNDAKEKVAVSDLENAFTMMMVQENATEIKETPIWSEGADVVTTLSSYMKITASTTYGGETCNEDSEYCFTTKKGVDVMLLPGNDLIKIDVNREKLPNKSNVDRFSYSITNDGFLERQ